jgi:hypothetical protein
MQYVPAIVDTRNVFGRLAPAFALDTSLAEPALE